MLLGLLAALGVALIADSGQSPELRHRLFAEAFGALCLVPVALLVLFGARTLSLLRRVALSGLALCAALLVLEGVARTFELRALAPPAFELDPALGRVHVPNRGSIDAWGFRNAGVPSHADVVVLGDSQTYGENIRRADAYPQRLAADTGLGVYNMSLGGYGPLQSLHLTARALSLAPRLLVLGFYAGNDLVDAHRFAALPYWASFRDPALEYAPPTELSPSTESSANLALALLDGMAERSWVLQRLTYDLKLALKSQSYFAGAYGRDGGVGILNEGPIRTRFSPDYRFGAMDPTRPEVRDGLRITRSALAAIAAQCERSGVQPLLFVLPTKERVYHDLFATGDEARAKQLERVAEAEAEVTARVIAAAQALGVLVVDPTPKLVDALREERALWPRGTDGHFNADGAALLAEVLGAEIARSGLAEAPTGSGSEATPLRRPL